MAAIPVDGDAKSPECCIIEVSLKSIAFTNHGLTLKLGKHLKLGTSGFSL